MGRIILLSDNEFITVDHLTGATLSETSGNRANIDFTQAGRGLSCGPTTAEPVMREVFSRLQDFVAIGIGGKVFDLQREIQNAELKVSSKV